MSPRLLKFSSHNVDNIGRGKTLKKWTRDCNQAAIDERIEKENKRLNFVIQKRNETLDRLSSRKLERFIT